MNKNFKLRYFFLMGVVIGALLFITIYGVSILNVTNDSWLLTGRDLQQHYLGWKFFRSADWFFPIGLHDSITYPYPISIMYTDSIPLFAIPCKMMSSVLPSTFQYFGIFGLFCFMLNGGFASIIVAKISRSKVVVSLGTVFFVLAPPILQRLYGFTTEHTRHTSLAAHFLVFAAIAIFMYHDSFKKYSKAALAWTALGIACVLIQMYFIFIVGGIMCAYLLLYIIRERDWKRLLVVAFSFGVGSAFVMYLMGGFSSGVSASMGGFGIYSANMNALLNPYRYSSILSAMKIDSGQYEGFSYLGLGMILLGIVALVILIVKCVPFKKNKVLWKKIRGKIVANKPVAIPVIIALVVFGLLALSNCVYMGSHFIVSVNFPKKVNDLFNVFRSSGRFMWVIMYFVMISSVYIVVHYLKKKWVIALLSVCLCIQIVDLSGVMLKIHKAYTGVVKVDNTEVASDIWNNIPDKYTKLDYYPIPKTMTSYVDNYLNVGAKVEENGMKMNYFYLSRANNQAIKAENRRLNTLFNKKEFEDDVIYLMTIDKAHKYINDLNYYLVDGNILGTKEPLENAPEYKDIILSKESPVSSFSTTKNGLGSSLVDDKWNAPDMTGIWSKQLSRLEVQMVGVSKVKITIEYEQHKKSDYTKVYFDGNRLGNIEKNSSGTVTFDVDVTKLSGVPTGKVDSHWLTFYTGKTGKGVDEYDQSTKLGIKIKKITMVNCDGEN